MVVACFLASAALAIVPPDDAPVRVPLQHQPSATVAAADEPTPVHVGLRKKSWEREAEIGGGLLFGVPWASTFLTWLALLPGIVSGTDGQSLLPAAVPVVGPLVSAAWVWLWPGRPLGVLVPYLLADSLLQMCGFALLWYSTTARADAAYRVAVLPAPNGASLVSRF